MRFIEHGPSIPDELLIARDEGRVVFFCGAGVSMQDANLPDFPKLTKGVLKKCHIREDEHIYKLFTDDKVSADRIFGLLEQEFDEDYLQKIAVQLLQPSDQVDLPAHRTLLDLATTAEGVTRIVTTNFDRLFESAAKGEALELFQPPDLPDMAFNGVVHLHGLANPTYEGAESKGGFVLTSSSYGKAYLAEGWATQFVRAILQKYIVVFIGYRADDPPIQYLLEALHKTPGLRNSVYAFECEDYDKWAHKGVKAIAYQGGGSDHSALWDTLKAWAKRAQSLDSWRQTVLDFAKQDPKTLKQFERGQVAHLVSTTAGTKAFANAADVPPAEWLCVFDANRRYAQPFRENIGLYELGKMYAPFDDYGLDSDSPPQRISAEDSYQKERKVPDNAWDGFKATLQEGQIPHFIFYGNVGNLSPRLNQLTIWLGKVADQPTALWWASHYRGLHSQAQARISWEILHGKKTINPVIRQAWGYLFEIWRDEITFRHTPEQNRFRPIDEFTRLVKMNGWSNQALRQYAAMTRPYLVVQLSDNPKPPLLHDNPNLSNLLDLKVQYFKPMNYIEIPNEWLACVIAELRKHLEYAIQLEKEVGRDKKLFHIGSILQSEAHPNTLYQFAIDFYEIFKKLAHFDSKLASREWADWLNKDESLFIRLCICAAGISGIVSDQAFFSLLVDLNDELFWRLRNRHDLLHVLAKRWNGLNEAMKKTLEKKLLAGRKPLDRETTEDFTKSKASEILNRLHWLKNHGCVFTFDLEKITQRLQADMPEWTPDCIDYAADSRLVTASSIQVPSPDQSEYKLLLEKLGDVLNSDNNFSIKAEQIASWPREELEQILQPLIESYKPVKRDPLISWLISEERLLIEFTASFYQLIDKLLEVIESMPAASLVSMEISHSHDWITDPTNSLLACLAKSLMNPSLFNSFADKGELPEQWLQSVEKLLALPENLRCFALIVFYQHVECLYSINPQWTETNFLTHLLSNDNYKLAFWAGFLCLGEVPKQSFYLKLKSQMLQLAKMDGLDSGFRRVLITTILDGWLNKCNHCNERWLTDDELHDVILHGGDELRQQLIWHIKEWQEEAWLNQLPKLFSDVWPRRLSVKTPDTSQALFDLVFSNIDIFQRIADPVLPLISQTTYWQLNEDIVQLNPIKALALIHKAFAENDRAHLPYDLEDTLNCIAEIQPELRKDSQWLALKRKLD